MLPAILVTILTFLLDTACSSPVYNMQPAFITGNSGFATNGRNIRNLPCISRKNNNLSGVCMFAIDCLKANGTHLGTCIDRFYFGSCCHIEPVKDLGNNIESNVILDSREPPERIHNTTLALMGNTSSTSSSTETSVITEVGSSISWTEKQTSSTSHPSSVSLPLSSTVKPFAEKVPVTISTSTEITTVPQKLQTFQIVGSSSIETTTFRTTSQSTTRKPNITTVAPIKTTSKFKPSQKPYKPTAATTNKPFKPVSTTKGTSKPIKPALSSTKRPYSTTRRTTTTKKVYTSTKKPTTKKPSSVKPTKVYTKPPIQTTSKPVSTTKRPLQTTTTKSTTSISSSTEKITESTTKPSSTTQKLVTTQPSSTTLSTSTSSQKPLLSTESTESTDITSIKNITSFESSTTINPLSNEVIESSGLLTIVNTTSSKPTDYSTTGISTTSISSESSSTTASSSTASSTSTTVYSSTTITSPSSTTSQPPGLVTWTLEDVKNTTTLAPVNETFLIGNVTNEWIPITTTDSWVLLPSVTTTSDQQKNESTSSTSSIEPVSTSESTSSPGLVEVPVPTTIKEPISPTTEEYVVSLTTTAAPNVTDIVNVSSIESSTSSSTGIMTSTTEEVTKKPVNMSDFTDVCGRRMWPEARIVGGEKSSFGKWPWQISLRQWRTSTYLHKCGAALLNENWAITAAHCVDNVPPSDLLLRLGEHDLSTEGEPYLHEERRVQIVASHPNFDPRTFEYDLALLRFYEPVQFQPNIIPICVPTEDENFVGRTAYVTGWGRLYEDGPLPSVLQEVSVPVINNSVCETMYRSAGYIEHIPNIFICAGWRKGGFDSCEGDSGGPMVIQREDKRFLLAGIISWGIGCAEPNQPGVYTRISEFRVWINKILQF